MLVTIGEKVEELGSEQLTKLGYVDYLKGLIIGEPTNYNLVYAHMESINYTIVSNGQTAHNSMPELENKAINHLNIFISKVNYKINKTYINDILGRTIHN